MLSALLTVTVVIGIILIGLLLFVLGKLSWLESATVSLLSKVDITPTKDQFQEIQMDPYFYGINGQELWNCLTGEETAQATPLELEEIRPRYGIVLIKTLIKFLQDGINIANDVIPEAASSGLEKVVYTSRGQIAIWLPSHRVEKLRALGANIASFNNASSKEENFKNDVIVNIHKEIRSEICDLCESLQLRHGSDIAADVLKAFPAGSDR
jgi:hypothetical protein